MYDMILDAQETFPLKGDLLISEIDVIDITICILSLAKFCDNKGVSVSTLRWLITYYMP
jgi:hypothetical protein